MNINKANEISTLVNRINKCKRILECIDKGCKDEFEIYYNGNQKCELEEEALIILIGFYTKEIRELEDKLEQY